MDDTIHIGLFPDRRTATDEEEKAILKYVRGKRIKSRIAMLVFELTSIGIGTGIIAYCIIRHIWAGIALGVLFVFLGFFIAVLDKETASPKLDGPLYVVPGKVTKANRDSLFGIMSVQFESDAGIPMNYWLDVQDDDVGLGSKVILVGTPFSSMKIFTPRMLGL